MKKKFLSILLIISMIFQSFLMSGVMAISAADDNILYENDAPIVVGGKETWSYGDNTWTDYEFELDITPTNKGAGGFVIFIRGTAYYTHINFTGSENEYPYYWMALQPTSGQSGDGWWDGIYFEVGKTTHLRFKVEGTNVSLYGKGDGNTTEITAFENIDITQFGTPIMSGGVGVQSRGGDVILELSNIVVRDLSTSEDPTDPSGNDEKIICIDTPTTLTVGDKAWYGEDTWTDYIIETTISDFSETASYGNYQIRFRYGTEGKYYYLQTTKNGWICLQDSITYSNLADYNGPAPTSSSPVTYRIEAIGNNIKVYINNNVDPVINYTDDYTISTANPWYAPEVWVRSIFASGKVGWYAENSICTIHNYSVTLISGTTPQPDPDDGIVINQPGPFSLPYILGDDTWKDYEIEFDLTPTVNGALKISLRGGAYYSWIGGTGSQNPGLQPSSGNGGVWGSGGVNFILNSPTHLKYRVEGTTISLWYTNPDSTDEIKLFGADISQFGNPTLNGGITITIDSWTNPGDATISNVIVRDLAGTIIVPDDPPSVDPSGEEIVVVDIAGPIQVNNREPIWYGDDTWTDYIIEADISNLAKASDEDYQWWNFQFRFRESGGAYYYTYINSSQVDLKDSVTWDPTWKSGTANASPVTDKVSYKFVVEGNFVTAYANGIQIFTYTNDSDPRIMDKLTSGKVGYITEGATCTMENLKITLINVDPNDPNSGTTIGSVGITPVNIPTAGVYPQGLYKNNRGNYTETSTWEPAVQSTFLPDTVYKAIYTLVPNNSNYFDNTTINDIGGISTASGVTATGIKDGDNYVVTVTFPTTGSTKAEFQEFQNTLFYDDFSGDSLDLNKWQNPLLYQWDRQGGSKWEAKNVSVSDGLLHLRYAKENAESNWISASAVRTKGQFENTYGYYEAKIKYPVHTIDRSGAWGAFWLYNDSVGIVGDGGIDGTEIDIIELSTVHLGGSNSALHWDGYGNAHKSYGTGGTYRPGDYASPTGIYDGEWHIYGFEWTPYEYIVYIDGKVMWRITNTTLEGLDSGICQNPVYIKLSIESQGDNTSDGWGGPIASGIWEDEMLIDYVVVYDRPKTDSTAPVYAEDYVTLDLNTVYDGQQPKIAATLKNVNQFAQNVTYSGNVTLDTPFGITTVVSQSYENLAYGQTVTLYFDIDIAVYNKSDKLQEVIKFNYTVNEINATTSEEIKFGLLEAVYAVPGDTWANSVPIDFAKGVISGGALASTLSPDDLSAAGKLAWDEDYLYILVEVTDDVHNQTYNAGGGWEGDGVQISMASEGKGHREMEFTLRSDTNEIIQYCYINNTGVTPNTGTIPQNSDTVKSVITRSGTTTIYEISIKWSYICIVNPIENDISRISITVNDRDNTGVRKYISLFDGITNGNENKGKGMGYLMLLHEEEISNAEFLQSIATDVIKNGFNGDNLVLTGKTLKLVFGEREIILSESANNKNVSGQINLGDGWWLIYDIKGNGSNVKEFKIIQK